MSVVNDFGIGNNVPFIPNLGSTAPSLLSNTIDASGEQVHMVGDLCLEGYTGSKTFSSSGGKIYWTSGAITFANAGTTVRVGIQDALSATGVAQGDGTFDVYKDLVGGTDTIGAFSTITTSMSSGSVSLSHGQKIAVAFSMNSRGGSDSVVVRGVSTQANPSSFLYPCITTNVTGSYVRASSIPNVIIEFDDGTIGWIGGGTAHVSGSSIVFNVDTGTADEYGNVIDLKSMSLCDGITVVVSALTNSSTDFELCLYSNPLSSLSLIEAITVDADTLGAAGVGTLRAMFSTARTLKPGSYGVTLRPTTTNNVTLNFNDVHAASHMRANGHYGSYAIRRLDNSGAFSDYNGGTAQTRRMPIALSVIGYDNGINNKPNYNLGV